VDPRRAPYRIDDLERDAWGLLDHLGARRAHLAGLSMGGFIAQRMALAAPSRVLSLAAISSTPDYATTLHAFGMCEPPTSGLPAPRAEWLDRIDRLSPDLSLIDFQLESWRYANGPRAPFDAVWWRALQAEANERGDDRAAGARHRRAAVPTQPKNLLPALRSLAVPALFVHGTDDPICPPEHARAAAAAAPGARLHLIEMMGHALGPPFLDEVAGAVLAGIRGARARGTGGAIGTA
jgi:pimeloyl-ACP methyl ester carboxylesterase